ncbi:hypothetical protein RM549_15590 [Salegentibacter sp. F188]|uniref:Uncharacterized protein n=1 Tax=Autumnicola patrickiae TaxID=3075591 RepID=A0ABU3E5F4_9FLAO|nr:hypothetical protein [Salegentibacter sp. F188]MDT0691218.1 hypothetical protein [Salegentibacter sp. F188]
MAKKKFAIKDFSNQETIKANLKNSKTKDIPNIPKPDQPEPKVKETADDDPLSFLDTDTERINKTFRMFIPNIDYFKDFAHAWHLSISDSINIGVNILKEKYPDPEAKEYSFNYGSNPDFEASKQNYTAVIPEYQIDYIKSLSDSQSLSIGEAFLFAQIQMVNLFGEVKKRPERLKIRSQKRSDNISKGISNAKPGI